jgi:hypothetical protein
MQLVCNFLQSKVRGTLDEADISVSSLQAQSKTDCVALLEPLFRDRSPSFCTLKIFLGVLGHQLKMFMGSPFFRAQNLRVMMPSDATKKVSVRTQCVDCLLKIAQEFSSQSVKLVRSKQHATMRGTIDDLLEQMRSMVSWEASNHLMMLFQRNTGAVTFLYRDPGRIDENIRALMLSQKCDPTKIWAEETPGGLKTELHRICGQVDASDADPTYVLTADNLLKMGLILMRVDAGLPVVVIGETGCGKTSLIKYLARTRSARFEVQDLHAGISESDIVSFIERCEQHAIHDGRPTWVFLDEINACDHLGLINDLMCHRLLNGRQIHRNLVLLAACNPYRARRKTAMSAGLDAKMNTKISKDKLSMLVYRVHPLPETLMEYIWDFGSLTESDELRYIASMVSDIQLPIALLQELAAVSQCFMREKTDEVCSVSLRDIRRFVKLAKWFKENRVPPAHRACRVAPVSESFYSTLEATLLALLHNYYARLPCSKDRRDYIQRLIEVLRKHNVRHFEIAYHISSLLLHEQLGYLSRMKIEAGTARNEALRENVFVLLVSILNRIPVFLVGKPGCSKSLSMQLIEASIRGQDSKDAFFKSMPAVYQISYQGSESSTSDGILKVFEKARAYKETNTEGVIPLVLLDEVGLAEISPFNPLKVLHSLLEPDTTDGKQVCPSVLCARLLPR